jgi:uncharacterized SAM-binding protein YcdF (DUF218 family)
VPEQPTHSPPRSRILKRLAIALVAFCFLLSVFYFFRAPILRAAANAWIVNEPATKADAIYLLGGGLDYRPFAAAKLYCNGLAPRVLVSQPHLSPTEEAGLMPTEASVARNVLLTNGVPPTALEVVGTNMTSTRDEAFALKSWVEQHNAHTVLIPTDIFHTRRVRWIFRKALRGTGAEVHVLALEPPRYDRTNWWHQETGIIAFQNEIIKSFYYHLKY